MKLNQSQIQQALICGKAIVFDEIDSTNEYLLTHHQELENGTVCLAEKQTAGRGRRGRTWYSPESENLYFSILWHYSAEDAANLPSLSLVVSLIIAESLQAQNVADIQIKWPNDIYYQGKKAGGILIESKIDRNAISLVIGIGLNLSMNSIDPSIVNQPWADFSRFGFDRTALAATLAQRLQHALLHFPETAFNGYLPRWQKFDCFYQKPVKLITANGDIHGISEGINPNGELLLRTAEGINAFAIGEISLRADD